MIKTQVTIITGTHPASASSCLTATSNLLSKRFQKRLLPSGKANLVLQPQKGWGRRKQAELCGMLAFQTGERGRRERETHTQGRKRAEGGEVCALLAL